MSTGKVKSGLVVLSNGLVEQPAFRMARVVELGLKQSSAAKAQCACLSAVKIHLNYRAETAPWRSDRSGGA
jgi:hypothetical protein